MRRWLVTGGVGFIGYHVTRSLLARGDHVTVLDDFSGAPYPTAMKERNAHDLEAAHGANRLEIRRACITDAASTRDAYHGKDGVVHLAALAGVRPSFHDPARYARVNVEGTATVLELAVAAKVDRVVMASSSSVYGNSTPLPANEDAAATEPESPYAATKRAAELCASAICKRAPTLACAALRFFTVYGPRQRPEMAITLFTRAVVARRLVTIFGDGTMRRDFTHVEDIVDGVIAALENARPGFRPYNLGSGAPITLGGLIGAIARVAGVAARIERAPVPLGDVDATFADIRRAREELGYEPRVGIEDGLRSVLDWVREDTARASSNGRARQSECAQISAPESRGMQ